MPRPAALRADQVPLRCERVSRIEGLLCVLPLALPEGKTRVRASPYGLMVDSVPWNNRVMVTMRLHRDRTQGGEQPSWRRVALASFDLCTYCSRNPGCLVSSCANITCIFNDLSWEGVSSPPLRQGQLLTGHSATVRPCRRRHRTPPRRSLPPNGPRGGNLHRRHVRPIANASLPLTGFQSLTCPFTQETLATIVPLMGYGSAPCLRNQEILSGGVAL